MPLGARITDRAQATEHFNREIAEIIADVRASLSSIPAVVNHIN